jgi:hypothetical protein
VFVSDSLWRVGRSSINNTVTIYIMFGIWCLTLLSSIFQGYRDGQFYLWKEPKNPKKTENMVENVVKDTYSIMYRLDI